MILTVKIYVDLVGYTYIERSWHSLEMIFDDALLYQLPTKKESEK